MTRCHHGATPPDCPLCEQEFRGPDRLLMDGRRMAHTRSSCALHCGAPIIPGDPVARLRDPDTGPIGLAHEECAEAAL